MKLYPHTWWSAFYAILRIAAALYVAVLALLYFAQARVIFLPSKLAENFNFQFLVPFETKLLEVDGLRIHSLLFKAQNAKGLILYFHGNAGDLSGWGMVGEEIVKRTSFDVWIVDYPGYGLSEGRVTSEEQLHRVAAAFMNEAGRRAGGTENVIVYGRSIGSGLAAKVASENNVRALILEAPYFSLTELARAKFSWAPLFLLRFTFRSDEWLPKVTAPVLIMHGDLDEVIPFMQGEQLARLAPRAQFRPVRGGHHNDLSDYPEYWSVLLNFLSLPLP